jgi:hypothetical protein
MTSQLNQVPLLVPSAAELNVLLMFGMLKEGDTLHIGSR